MMLMMMAVDKIVFYFPVPYLLVQPRLFVACLESRTSSIHDNEVIEFPAVKCQLAYLLNLGYDPVETQGLDPNPLTIYLPS